MLSREDLIAISEARLSEAKALQANGMYDGAYYLAGYAIETALKARICKLLKTNYPEKDKIGSAYKIHDLNDLIFLGGLSSELNNKVKHIIFKTNWSEARKWSESARYEKPGGKTVNDIKNFFDALEHPHYGILTWIKKKW